MSKKLLITIIVLFGLISCEPFVEVEPPKERLISETVFEDAATVESALANIYVKMRQEGLVSGNFGLSISIGIYTDELDYFDLEHTTIEFEFEDESCRDTLK